MNRVIVHGCIAAAFLLTSSCQTGSPAASSHPYTVIVPAAEVDRTGEVVAFKYPAGLAHDMVLADDHGNQLPLQVDEQGNAVFFVPAQKAGEKLTYTIRAGPVYVRPPDPAAMAAKEDGRLRFAVNNEPVFYYQMDLAKPPRDGIDVKIWRGAFLYPLYTPKGVQVSDTYPVDHPHDHGIWTAWASSMFQGRHVDFWNPHYAYGGTVEFVALDKTWSGMVAAGFESQLRSMDRTVTPPRAALDEKWKVTLYAAPGLPARMFDLEFTQTPATEDPLEVLQYTYGGLGVRGHIQWQGRNGMSVLTSEGITDRVRSNNQPARWVFIGGNIDGAPAGIAVLCHPDNFRAPQTVRMNPDGPFFMYAPNITGGFSITKEQPYHARYRFIVQDGPPDAKFLEACWQAFAHPAVATVASP